MPKTLWFKRKTYGWGWTPCTWQGWLVIAIYALAIIALATRLSDNPSPHELVYSYTLPIIGLTVVLIAVSAITGEKPRWQWGEKK